MFLASWRLNCRSHEKQMFSVIEWIFLDSDRNIGGSVFILTDHRPALIQHCQWPPVTDTSVQLLASERINQRSSSLVSQLMLPSQVAHSALLRKTLFWKSNNSDVADKWGEKEAHVVENEEQVRNRLWWCLPDSSSRCYGAAGEPISFHFLFLWETFLLSFHDMTGQENMIFFLDDYVCLMWAVTRFFWDVFSHSTCQKLIKYFCCLVKNVEISINSVFQMLENYFSFVRQWFDFILVGFPACWRLHRWNIYYIYMSAHLHSASWWFRIPSVST